VNELIERQGWSVGPNNPARGVLAEALAMVHRLGLDDVLARLDSYADAVAGVAEVDVELALGRPSLDEVAERVVVWTCSAIGCCPHCAGSRRRARPPTGSLRRRRSRASPAVDCPYPVAIWTSTHGQRTSR